MHEKDILKSAIYFGAKNDLLTQEFYLSHFWVGSVTATYFKASLIRCDFLDAGYSEGHQLPTYMY
jgi:hypothetical protein